MKERPGSSSWRRALAMVARMNAEGFGNCSWHGECHAACPKSINHEWLRASVAARRGKWSELPSSPRAEDQETKQERPERLARARPSTSARRSRATTGQAFFTAQLRQCPSGLTAPPKSLQPPHSLYFPGSN